MIAADPINELLKIYVKFHAEAKEHPELEDEARHYFKLLEDGDPEVTALWRFFVDASLNEFNRMYRLLDISFDSFAGESFYSDKMPEVVDILEKEGLLEESEGATAALFTQRATLPPPYTARGTTTSIRTFTSSERLRRSISSRFSLFSRKWATPGQATVFTSASAT